MMFIRALIKCQRKNIEIAQAALIRFWWIWFIPICFGWHGDWSTASVRTKDIEDGKPTCLDPTWLFLHFFWIAHCSFVFLASLNAKKHLQISFPGLLETTLTRSKNGFEEDILHPLWSVSQWQSSIVKQFGATASESPAFTRLVDFLMTKGGLVKVKCCRANKTRLHGSSDRDVGIQDRCPKGVTNKRHPLILKVSVTDNGVFVSIVRFLHGFHMFWPHVQFANKIPWVWVWKSCFLVCHLHEPEGLSIVYYCDLV